MPESLRIISDMAFQMCNKLQKVILNEGIEVIGSWAFSNCELLTDINLPDSLCKIGRGAFQWCPIRNINIPSNMSVIEPGAFEGIEIETLYIPSTIQRIEGSITEYDGEEERTGAFSGCSNLKKVVISEEVEYIHPEAFAWCRQLSELDISPRLLASLKRNGYVEGFRETPISWKYSNLCSYCGGTFKGLFTKVCTRCDKQKNY